MHSVTRSLVSSSLDQIIWFDLILYWMWNAVHFTILLSQHRNYVQDERNEAALSDISCDGPRLDTNKMSYFHVHSKSERQLRLTKRHVLVATQFKWNCTFMILHCVVHVIHWEQRVREGATALFPTRLVLRTVRKRTRSAKVTANLPNQKSHRTLINYVLTAANWPMHFLINIFSLISW